MKYKLKLYRLLSDLFSSRLYNIIIRNYKGKNLCYTNKLYYKFHSLVYDYIDYIYGPSQLAELSAQRTGYWNLELTNWIGQIIGLNSIKNKQAKDLAKLYLLKEFKVNKY